MEQQPDNYMARVSVDGATVRIDAPSMEVLIALVARLADPLASVSSAAVGTLVVSNPVKAAMTRAEEKAAVLAAAAPSEPQPGKSAPPAQDPAPTSPTATVAADAVPVSYDDVKRLINALYAIDPKHAVGALADFNVVKGTQLDPTQWVDFFTKGSARLTSLKVPA